MVVHGDFQTIQYRVRKALEYHERHTSSIFVARNYCAKLMNTDKVTSVGT